MPNNSLKDVYYPQNCRKIRELLYTLEANEVRVLEMLLCNLEEPANIANKLKEVQHSMQEREKTLEGKVQALKLQAKLTAKPEGDETTPAAAAVHPQQSQLKRLSSIPCACAEGEAVGASGRAEAEALVADIVESIVKEAVER